MFRIYLPLYLALSALAGCAGSSGTPAVSTPTMLAKTEPTKAQTAEDIEIASERAKLSPEDRKLVDAQEWCVISYENRLGSMDAPIKLEIKGQPVFICCKGCKRKAESDPDATLAKLAALKVKAAKK